MRLKHLLPLIILLISVNLPIANANEYKAVYELVGIDLDVGHTDFIFKTKNFSYGYKMFRDIDFKNFSVAGIITFNCPIPSFDSLDQSLCQITDTLFFIVYNDRVEYMLFEILSYPQPTLILGFYYYIPENVSRQPIVAPVGYTFNIHSTFLYVDDMNKTDIYQLRYYIAIEKLNQTHSNLDIRFYTANGSSYIATLSYPIRLENVYFIGVGSGWTDVYLIDGELMYSRSEIRYHDKVDVYSYTSPPPRYLFVLNEIKYFNMNGDEVVFTIQNVSYENLNSFILIGASPLLFIPLIVKRLDVFTITTFTVIYTLVAILVVGYDPFIALVLTASCILTHFMVDGGELW